MRFGFTLVLPSVRLMDGGTDGMPWDWVLNSEDKSNQSKPTHGCQKQPTNSQTYNYSTLLEVQTHSIHSNFYLFVDGTYTPRYLNSLEHLYWSSIVCKSGVVSWYTALIAIIFVLSTLTISPLIWQNVSITSKCCILSTSIISLLI